MISVIVPVYNTEEYLPGCIKSILGQSYYDIELILVDDGSTDNSGAICDEYANQDNRIRVVHSENHGQGHARNIGIDLAEGEYISFIDSDDEIDQDMYSSMIKIANEQQADLIICAIKQRFEASDDKYVSKTDKVIKYDNHSLMLAYVSSNDIGTGPCNKLYKKTLWNDIRFPDLRANEDSYIMHAVIGKSNVAVHVTEAFYLQNVRDGSTEQSFTPASLNIIQSGEQLRSYILEYYPDLYGYVAFEKIKRMVVAQEKIVINGSYRKNKDLYWDIADKLKEEYHAVTSQGHVEKDVNDYIKRAIEKPRKFLIDLICLKVKNTIKKSAFFAFYKSIVEKK